MSQASTVARLAARELWMSFRLLLVLLVSVGAGAVVGLLPAPLPEAMARLAIGLGLGTAVAAGVAAWSLAEERLSGRAGWLVTRSVPRGTYLAGWFTALALVAGAGLAAGAVLGWLAIPRGSTGIDAAEYVAAAVSVGAALGAAVAVGLLAGALLRPRGAMLVALAACAGLAVLALLLAQATAWLPSGAFLLLARAAEPDDVTGDALRVAGIGLALASALLVGCRVALERADL